jgi:hypothetical protein
MAGDTKRSDEWSRKAYDRNPDADTAFNFALAKQRAGDKGGFEALMEEALEHDPESIAALELYGDYLKRKGSPRGIELITKAFGAMKKALDEGTLRESDFPRLERAATTLGKRQVLKEIQARRAEIDAEDALYREEYLAAGSSEQRLTKGG